jgi:hypothetical protein
MYNAKINQCYRFFIELNAEQIPRMTCTMFKINGNPTNMSQKYLQGAVSLGRLMFNVQCSLESRRSRGKH